MGKRHYYKEVKTKKQSVKCVCAWCGLVLKEPESETFIISHGMCEPCSNKVREETAKWKPRELV